MNIKRTFGVLFICCLAALIAPAQSGDLATNSTAAAVYFYSLKSVKTIGKVKALVFLDDKEIAETRPEKYFIVRLSPGKHAFHLKEKKYGGIEMEFEAGKTYYLKMGWQIDFTVKPSGITLVAPESGAFDIKQLKPVDEKNIKDTTKVVRE